MTKKDIVLGLIFLVSSAALTAQVGINNNDPKATLDVTASKDPTKPDGIIAPHIEGDILTSRDNLYNAPQDGALVYVTAVCGTPSGGKTANITAIGYYYYDAYATNPDGGKGLWKAVGTSSEQWFYMPSVKLPLTSPGPTSFNLFEEYLSQFKGDGSSTVAGGYVASAGASGLPYVTDTTKIEFYVTAYSKDVIDNVKVYATGKMIYDVISTTVPEGSFINVIFKLVKP